MADRVDELESRLLAQSTRSGSVSYASKAAIPKRGVKDFVFGKLLGEGSYSTVYLARDVLKQKMFAIKVCIKDHIKREKKVQSVMREKEVLNLLSDTNQYFVRLYCTFQDARHLYFALTYAPGGELAQLIKKFGKFTEDLTRFYTCQLVKALEVLNQKGILHRDLKPENILLDVDMNILITDFGSAKLIDKNEVERLETDASVDDRSRNSFVGSPHVVSPEVLTNSGPVTFACDLWALGCIIYNMITGKLCFEAETHYLTFNKILNLQYEMPDELNGTYVCDLIRKFIVLNASSRLGANDTTPYASIRNHAFFQSIRDWRNLGSAPIPNHVKDEVITEVTDNIFTNVEPGLTSSQMAELAVGNLADDFANVQFSVSSNTITGDDDDKVQTKQNGVVGNGLINPNQRRSIADLTKAEIEERLRLQERENTYHKFVEGNLIIKQGLLDKRKGLIPRRRMFLMTLGPHLYYVDPNAMVLKGEIPWTPELETETKTFKHFYIHTPNRSYNLEDPAGFALQWRVAIDDVHGFYFKKD